MYGCFYKEEIEDNEPDYRLKKPETAADDFDDRIIHPVRSVRIVLKVLGDYFEKSPELPLRPCLVESILHTCVSTLAKAEDDFKKMVFYPDDLEFQAGSTATQRTREENEQTLPT